MKRQLLWLAVVLAPLLVLRVMKDAGPGPYGLDASLYVQLARQVADGNGLVTTVSLYHHGLQLPARSTTQPLWPLLLGYTGRAIGLIEAATLLPRIFYVIALLLLFTLVRRIASRFEEPSALTTYAPHAVVALFGTNVMFFSTTTHPYREGVTYCVGFAALLTMDRIARKRSVSAALVAGALAGLAILGRREFAALAVGCVVALAICRIAPRLIVAYGIAAAGVVLPWILWLGHVPGFGGLGAWVPRPAIAIPRPVRTPLSSTGKLRDMLDAALTMFQLGDPESYTRTWGIAALLVPFAALVALLVWVRRHEKPLPRDLTTLATALTGFVAFLELLVYRGGDFTHFVYGWRHGLLLIFLVAVAVPFLLAQRNLALRVVTSIAIVVSILTGSIAVVRFVQVPNLSYTPNERALLRWLPPKATVLTTRAQNLGMASRAHFHDTDCDSPPETTIAYVEKVRVDYVLVFEPERRCRFTRGLGGLLTPRASFGDGPQRIWVLERKVTP